MSSSTVEQSSLADAYEQMRLAALQFSEAIGMTCEIEVKQGGEVVFRLDQILE